MANGPQKPGMNIVTRRYKDGSIIYFEGDRSDYVYILKGGKVVLSFIKIDTGEEVKETIKIGEFFGVKSAIGKYPREETAQTTGETTVLAVNRADFEKMILKNVSLVTKMLRVFSNQLRKIGKIQREILGETDSINPAEELFKIGEYYYKSGKSQQALYSYKRYLEHYPGTKFSDHAMKRIRAIETGDVDSDLEFEGSAGGKAEEPLDAKVERDGFDLTDFSIEDDGGDSGSGAGNGMDLGDDSFSPPSNGTEDLDDFLHDDDHKSMDDFSFDDSQDDAAGTSNDDITEIFYEAVSLFSQEKHGEALELYKKIMEMKSLKNDSEKKIFEKTHFEVGRCYLKLKKYNDAVSSLSTMVKKFPKSELVKNALYHIGLSYEMTKKVDSAATYYKKVASMEPKDPINKLAMKRLKSFS